MTCESCARHVQRALAAVGARDVDVDWRAGRASASTDGLSRRELARALDGTAYGVERIIGTKPAADVDPAEYDYDLAIVGSGGGAFAAAIAGRDRALRV